MLHSERNISRNGSRRDRIQLSEAGQLLHAPKETTIRSEDVYYLAARKKYNQDNFSVFTRWEKSGASDFDGSARTEFYKVHIDQRVLESFNFGYVIIEDFAAYKKLNRPAAKVIIGNLYYWFGAADEPYAERDYGDICNLLGITCYKHPSKIKEKFGPSLDELIAIGYLAKWEVQRMSLKTGFKICMWAGPELLRTLDLVKDMLRRKQTALPSETKTELTVAQQLAVEELVKHGVTQAKARDLAVRHKPQTIHDQLEYGQYEINNGKKKFDNPPGYLIWRIDGEIPIPSAFFAARMRDREILVKQENQKVDEERWDSLHHDYHQWTERHIETEINDRFSAQQLDDKLCELVESRIRPDKIFRACSGKDRREQALKMLRRDIAKELMLPSFLSWLAENPQGELFQTT